MALKRPSTLFGLPISIRLATHQQSRSLHRLNAPVLRAPQPTPFVPDVQTFLTLIGRGLSQHAAKIPSWEALFTLSSQQLKESGIEPPRARRYLLWWRERFRNGIIGIGGDLQHVKDGTAELRIVEIPSDRKRDQIATLTKDPGTRKIIINTPPSVVIEEEASEKVTEEAEGGTEESLATRIPSPPMRIQDAKSVKPVLQTKIHQGTSIGGRGVELVKGHQGVARLKVSEGLWEQRRGHKVDGGERRKAMVRAKRRMQEKKMKR